MANVQNVLFKKMARATFDALQNKDNGTLYRVVNTDLSEDFYIGAKKLNNAADITAAIAALDADLDASGTAQHGGTFVVSGITEADGVITSVDSVEVEAAGAAAALADTLADVATSGAAADVSITDTGSYFTATDVEGALAELAQASAGGVSSKTVYITETAGGSGDAFSKRYGIYQGANGSSASPVAGEKLGDIDIPKDMVVESGSVVTITYDNGKLYDGATDVTELIKGAGGTATSADAGKYIKLVIANSASSVLYIAAKDLVDIYTAEQNATQVQLTIDANNVISAVIVDGSVDADALASNAVTTAKIADDAVTADKIAISAHTESQTAGADGIAISVTTTDGQVSAVSASVAANTYDPYGAAANAVAALDTASDVTIASKSGDIVTIAAGISETDGVIGAGSGTAIALAAVASTGDAEDVSYDNTTSQLTATDVQAAIDEIAGTAGSAVQSVVEGTVDKAINVDGTTVYVHGLGTAATEDATAFDPSGSASTAQSNAEDYARGLLVWEEIS